MAQIDYDLVESFDKTTQWFDYATANNAYNDPELRARFASFLNDNYSGYDSYLVNSYSDIWDYNADLQNQKQMSLELSDPTMLANRMRAAGLNPDIQGLSDIPSRTINGMPQNHADNRFQNALGILGSFGQGVDAVSQLLNGGIGLKEFLVGLQTTNLDNMQKSVSLLNSFGNVLPGLLGDNIKSFAPYITQSENGQYTFDLQGYNSAKDKFVFTPEYLSEFFPDMAKSTANSLSRYANKYMISQPGQAAILESFKNYNKSVNELNKDLANPVNSGVVGRIKPVLDFQSKLTYYLFVARTQMDISVAQFNKALAELKNPKSIANALNKKADYDAGYFEALDFGLAADVVNQRNENDMEYLEFVDPTMKAYSENAQNFGSMYRGNYEANYYNGLDPRLQADAENQEYQNRVEQAERQRVVNDILFRCVQIMNDTSSSDADRALATYFYQAYSTPGSVNSPIVKELTDTILSLESLFNGQNPKNRMQKLSGESKGLLNLTRLKGSIAKPSLGFKPPMLLN